MPRQFILSRLFWFITWTISLIIWHSGRWDFMNDSGNSINSFSQWIEKRREKNLHKVKQLKACGRPSNTNKLPLVWTFYCQWFEYLKIWTPWPCDHWQCSSSGLSSNAKVPWAPLPTIPSYIITRISTEHWSVQHIPVQEFVSYLWLLDQVSRRPQAARAPSQIVQLYKSGSNGDQRVG